MWEVYDGAIVPYRMQRNPKTQEWTAHCKFCLFYSSAFKVPANAGAQVITHAKQRHYDFVSGLYFSDEKLEQVRAATRERRAILGSHEDTQNLNQAGL